MKKTSSTPDTDKNRTPQTKEKMQAYTIRMPSKMSKEIRSYISSKHNRFAFTSPSELIRYAVAAFLRQEREIIELKREQKRKEKMKKQQEKVISECPIMDNTQHTQQEPIGHTEIKTMYQEQLPQEQQPQKTKKFDIPYKEIEELLPMMKK